MNCPFCGKEMVKGVLVGDGRSKVRWEAANQKSSVMDRIVGVGVIDASYSLAKFKIESDYCYECKKMIFSTNIAK